MLFLPPASRVGAEDLHFYRGGQHSVDEKTDPCSQKWLEPLPRLRVIIIIKTIIIIVGQIVPAPGSPTAEILIL